MTWLSVRAVMILLAVAGFAWLNVGVAQRLGRADVQQRKLLYRMIVGCGVLGGMFGVVMDQITCTLSPDYFVLMKEIEHESEKMFRLRVADLGFAAGMVPGMIAGGCLAAVVSVQQKATAPADGQAAQNPPLNCRQLLAYLWIPISTMMIVMPFLVWWNVRFDLGSHHESLRLAIPAVRIDRLNMVQAIHQSAYIGGIVGTVVGTFLAARRVKRLRGPGAPARH